MQHRRDPPKAGKMGKAPDPLVTLTAKVWAMKSWIHANPFRLLLSSSEGNGFTADVLLSAKPVAHGDGAVLLLLLSAL